MYTRIVQAKRDPRLLEALYRQDPQEFKKQFPSVFAQHPDSHVLQVWHERLFFQETAPADSPTLKGENVGSSRTQMAWLGRGKELLLLTALIVLGGTLLKLPHWLPIRDESLFYIRNTGLIFAGALMLYFLLNQKSSAKLWMALCAVTAGAALYVNLLPPVKESQTLLLVSLHLPILLWSLVGVAFAGSEWRTTLSRWDYLRYNGEMVIYMSIVSLGGLVLTFITILLFSLIEMNIAEWYVKTIGPYGAVAIPLVATVIIQRIAGDRFRIAPILAKLFTPLFLVMVTAYLIILVLAKKSPYTDRDFLTLFNALLFLVLALTVFSLSERRQEARSHRSDYVTFALIVLTLVLDLVALSAIGFRLGSYGLTPNRLAVLGANLAVLGHLVGIVYYYVRFMKQDQHFEKLIAWVTGYLPVYTVWSLIVILGFPLLFGFGDLNP
ncbi:DUF4153 domain-containing protein [candidate division KSB1 bacterium]|nr:DUF4153 domain-containing protein [candidate division KSB1 bacterium]